MRPGVIQISLQSLTTGHGPIYLFHGRGEQIQQLHKFVGLISGERCLCKINQAQAVQRVDDHVSVPLAFGIKFNSRFSSHFYQPLVYLRIVVWMITFLSHVVLDCHALFRSIWIEQKGEPTVAKFDTIEMRHCSLDVRDGDACPWSQRIIPNVNDDSWCIAHWCEDE